MDVVEPEAGGDKPTKKRDARTDLLGHLILTAPVFLLYHLGLLVSPSAANGADPITRMMGYLAGLSWTVYLGVMLLLAVIYVLVVHRLRKTKKFNPKRFPVVLLESTVYALVMGPLTNLLLRKIHLIGMVEQMGPVDRVVASAGAGFYEELVFRLVGVGALLWFFKARKMKNWMAVLLALLITSVVFSAFHYIGPGSDTFEVASFVFRLVLGVFLGAIFLLRGFATAVYAHFLYDVYVMLFLMA
jgi:hypothetical protein